MRIYHLNCGTLRSFITTGLLGTGTLRNPPPLITHCLLVATAAGLLLVDTGFGTRDYTHPTPIVRIFTAFNKYRHDLKETAIRQITRLGYDPADVKHIAVTHMHLDHVGGLPDFPHAKVHIYAEEYAGITHPHTIEERFVCRREHWEHRPDWAIHHLGDDQWFGFDRTQPNKFGDTEFFLVPLTGHTRGNSAVVVRTLDGWLMHCGDTYIYHGDVHPEKPFYPPHYISTLSVMGLMAPAFRVFGKHSPRLRQLIREHGDEVQIFCSHDHHEFARLRAQNVTQSQKRRGVGNVKKGAAYDGILSSHTPSETPAAA